MKRFRENFESVDFGPENEPHFEHHTKFPLKNPKQSILPTH